MTHGAMLAGTSGTCIYIYIYIYIYTCIYIYIYACVRVCVCVNRITGKLHAVVHSGAQIDDLHNYVRTMRSHSMRKYFLLFVHCILCCIS